MSKNELLFERGSDLVPGPTIWCGGRFWVGLLAERRQRRRTSCGDGGGGDCVYRRAAAGTRRPPATSSGRRRTGWRGWTSRGPARAPRGTARRPASGGPPANRGPEPGPSARWRYRCTGRTPRIRRLKNRKITQTSKLRFHELSRIITAKNCFYRW